MSQELTSTKSLKRTLGFWDLMSASVGQIIGAGIMSLTGVAIGMTGRSVPIAFILAAIMVLISSFPITLISSVARFRGGYYSMIGSLLGEKWTGMYLLISIFANISISMYCLSFADYALPFLPMIPRKALAIGILIIMYTLNYTGIDSFAKVQNLIVFLLVVALAMFSAFGISKLEPNYYDPETFLSDGALGLLSATAQLTFATGGATVIANLSGEAINPEKDIPKVIIFSTLGVAVLYAFMSTIAAGVLPVEQVADQPLTLVAEKVLPRPLFVFFIIGGAWFALISTLNSKLASSTKPLMQAASDGWLPKGMAKLHPKFRTPIYLLTIFLLVGLIPIIFNLNISVISKLVTTLGTVTNTMIALSLFGLKRVMSEHWEKSPFHITDGQMKALIVVCLIWYVFQAYLLGRLLPPAMLIGNVVVGVLAYVFATVRYNSGKVDMEISYELADMGNE